MNHYVAHVIIQQEKTTMENSKDLKLNQALCALELEKHKINLDKIYFFNSPISIVFFNSEKKIIQESAKDLVKLVKNRNIIIEKWSKKDLFFKYSCSFCVIFNNYKFDYFIKDYERYNYIFIYTPNYKEFQKSLKDNIVKVFLSNDLSHFLY
jgi:hypothetical protein